MAAKLVLARPARNQLPPPKLPCRNHHQRLGCHEHQAHRMSGPKAAQTWEPWRGNAADPCGYHQSRRWEQEKASNPMWQTALLD